MGDRVTVSFKDNNGKESVSIYHHWGGKAFPALARHWFKNHYKQPEHQEIYANKVVVQFIAWLGKHDKSTYFNNISINSIDIVEKGFDDSDNGHYTIFTKDGRMTNGSGEYIE